MPDTWSDTDEAMFRKWLNLWSKNTGVSYNPDNPMYDYRKVYQLGLHPMYQPEHGEYRWPDVGKKKGYKEQYTPEETMPYLIWDKLFGGYPV